MIKMRSKTKKISILIIVGIVFPLLVNLRFNISVEQNFIENIECSDLQAPIFINATATGVDAHNWTWAEEQPWCSGSGTDIDPYVIQNLTINGFETVSCIEIRNSTAFFIIKDCTLYNSSKSSFHAGIKLVNVNNGTLFNNNCSFNENFGIFLSESDFNNITENTANNNGDNGIGIIIYIDCNNNIVSGNTANNNNDGIYIGESDNNIITGNTANYNKYGITDQWGWYNTFSRNIANYNTESGMYFSSSNFASVSDNTVNGNIEGITLESLNFNSTFAGNNINGNDYGIFLYRSDFNNISGNNIKNNEYGIYFDVPNPSYSCDDYNITKNILYNNTIGIYFELDSDNNSIYENFFLKNGKHAIDEGTDNTWNSTTIGNYWDNWTSPDLNPNDGIVDLPYNISGLTGSKDYLPIAEDGAPSITINSPTSSDVFGVTAPSFDVTITDDYLDSRWYTIDGGINNYTFIENGIINQTAWAALAEGSVILTFYASDIPENIASEVVIITKDFEVPVVQITSPTQGNVFGVSAPSFDVTITDDYLDSMWYTLDGGLHNYTFTVNGSIEQPAWNAISDGAVILKFYANDTLGHVGSAEVSVVKDATAPIIVINSPTDSEEFGTQAPLFNITVTDDHLDSIWYSFDGGLTIYAITTNATANQTAWTALTEGDVTITFYANDTLGNEASEAVTVVKLISAAGFDPGIIIIITIVVVSIAGGVAVAAVIYIYIKKRSTIA